MILYVAFYWWYFFRRQQQHSKHWSKYSFLFEEVKTEKTWLLFFRKYFWLFNVKSLPATEIPQLDLRLIRKLRKILRIYAMLRYCWYFFCDEWKFKGRGKITRPVSSATPGRLQCGGILATRTPRIDQKHVRASKMRAPRYTTFRTSWLDWEVRVDSINCGYCLKNMNGTVAVTVG